MEFCVQSAGAIQMEGVFEVIHIDRELSEAALKAGIAEYFGINAERVFVGTNHAWLDAPDEDFVCNITKLEGDFPLLLLLISRHKDLNPPNTIDDMIQMSRCLECKILIHDGVPLNFSVWIEVSPDGTYRKARLNMDMLGKDQFVIDEYLE